MLRAMLKIEILYHIVPRICTDPIENVSVGTDSRYLRNVTNSHTKMRSDRI